MSTSRFKDTGCTARSLSVEVGAYGFVHMWSHLFHLSQAQSDQLCVLTLPAFVSWSTCSRRADCQQESSHTTSALSAPKQAEKWRQAVAASLSDQFLFYLPNSDEKEIQQCFFLPVQVCEHRTWDCGLEKQYDNFPLCLQGLPCPLYVLHCEKGRCCTVGAAEQGLFSLFPHLYRLL